MSENSELSDSVSPKTETSTECDLNPVWRDLLCDSRVMFDHARKTGVRLPPGLAEKLESAITNAAQQKPVDTKQLQDVYNRLLAVLAPATPQSINASDPTVTWWRRAKRRGMVYSMLVLSGVCLIGYVWTLSEIGGSDSTPSALQLAFHLVFAAGLGAAFNALFTAYGYLVKRTYDPKYTTTYWIRFALGIVGGVILAQFINPENVFRDNGSILNKLTPGLIALLGGYAANAVQLILKRIVEMLVTLVQGGAEARIQTVTEQLKAQQERDQIRRRLAIIRQIGKHANNIGTETDPAKLKEKLEELQLSVLEDQENDT